LTLLGHVQRVSGQKLVRNALDNELIAIAVEELVSGCTDGRQSGVDSGEGGEQAKSREDEAGSHECSAIGVITRWTIPTSCGAKQKSTQKAKKSSTVELWRGACQREVKMDARTTERGWQAKKQEQT